MKTVLCLTGQPYSIKFGGLERWYERNAQLGKTKFKFILAFLEKLPTPEILQKFKESGIDCINFDPQKEGFAAYKALLKFHEIDIVHCHFENSAFYLIPSKLCGKKTFLTFHMANFYVENLDWKSSRKTRLGVLLYKIKYKVLSYFVDHFFFVSNSVKSQHQSFFKFSSSKCKTLYLGVNNKVSKYIPKTEFNSVPIITTIGFLDDIKGIDILLRSLKILSDRQVPFTAQIIGSPLNKNNQNKYKEQVEKLKISNSVSFLGNRNDIYSLLNASDIYCQPSRSEALGFTIMEAMECALPIVASKVGGIPELIIHNKEGFLYDTNDISLLADYLQLLIENPKLRIRMGNTALCTVRQDKFDIDKNILELHYIYTTL
tara:strand:+ start:8754 stop:9875 length:1122 start_codon:yes stop_codon:yes gene_type:complete